MSTTVVVEFTIEPFVEGEPGHHVTAAIAAVEALGLTVDVGPFGSSFTCSATSVGDAVKAVLDAAYSHGATHVNVNVEPHS
jgi:uncharacterized protein YqgV (UPF0045/DUF77 family)